MDLKARILATFQKTLAALEEAAALEGIAEDIKRDSVLLRFELAAEIMPKALKRVLEERGATAVLPKDLVRVAVAGEIISEDLGLSLLAVIDDRNRMVHDYSESYAKELYARVTTGHLPALKKLANRL